MEIGNMVLDTQYSLLLDKLEVSSTAIISIGELLKKHGYNYYGIFNINPTAWKTDRGTLPKRLASYYSKYHGKKLPTTLLEEAGNIARQSMLETTKYTFDITRKLQWDDGDFGDSGSCYWGVYKHARLGFMAAGIMALRFYEPKRGRSWMLMRPSYVSLFNGYGINSRQQAIVLAKFLGIERDPVKTVVKRPTKRTADDVYLNRDAYIIPITRVYKSVRIPDRFDHCSCISTTAFANKQPTKITIKRARKRLVKIHEEPHTRR